MSGGRDLAARCMAVAEKGSDAPMALFREFAPDEQAPDRRVASAMRAISRQASAEAASAASRIAGLERTVADLRRQGASADGRGVPPVPGAWPRLADGTPVGIGASYIDRAAGRIDVAGFAADADGVAFADGDGRSGERIPYGSVLVGPDQLSDSYRDGLMADLAHRRADMADADFGAALDLLVRVTELRAAFGDGAR